MTAKRALGVLLPLASIAFALAAWEGLVRLFDVKPYLLPAPSLIFTTLVADWPTLFSSMLVTLSITFQTLVAAAVGGVLLAVVFSLSWFAERVFFPYLVILQVTPIVAIAPLLLVWLDTANAVRVCGFLVAFFPIVANTTLGIRSVDHNLLDLFQLYRAPSWRQLTLLRLPSALPYFLGGLRISGGLALIGAVVAELVAGSAGQGSGLAFRIIESMFREKMPRAFACIFLITATGLLIYLCLAALSRALLQGWHESARAREA